MNQTPEFRDTDSVGDLDVALVLRSLWAGKWLIAGIGGIFCIVAIVVALMLPNIYRAEALLSPSSQERNNGLAGLASRYGGLASLAGINLANDAGDKTTLGIEVLTSRKFIMDFIEKHDLMVPLMAARGWDSGSGKLLLDGNKFDEESGQWRDTAGEKKPSLQEAYRRFRDLLTVEQDNTTGFVTIAVDFYSPSMAKLWVDWLIEDLNLTIMSQDVAEAEQAIDYLKGQIESTSIGELRSVFFNLIEEQTKTVLLASVSGEYLFKTVDPAIAPDRKAKPRRAIIVLLCTSIGLFLSMLFVIVRASMGASKV